MDTTTITETTTAETTNIMDATTNDADLSFSTFARPGEQTLSPLSPVSPVTPEAPVEPVLLLDPSAGRAEFMEPLPSSPPMTPPRSPSATVTEPPPVIRRRFVRTFRAERAGSDTEDSSDEDDARVLPMPTSPLVRQVGRCLQSDDDVETEAEAEGGELTDDEASDAEEEAEGGNGVLVPAPNGMVIQLPVWLFVTTLVAMVTYLFFVVYLLAWSCPAVRVHR
jgi:hypothetical protein